MHSAYYSLCCGWTSHSASYTVYCRYSSHSALLQYSAILPTSYSGKFTVWYQFSLFGTTTCLTTVFLWLNLLVHRTSSVSGPQCIVVMFLYTTLVFNRTNTIHHTGLCMHRQRPIVWELFIGYFSDIMCIGRKAFYLQVLYTVLTSRANFSVRRGLSYDSWWHKMVEFCKEGDPRS